MAKQKPKAKGSRKRSDGQSAAQESKPNLFERLYNRKKFDILGKKAKGERKHGQSVHDAVDKVMPHAVAAVEPAEPFREKKSFWHTCARLCTSFRTNSQRRWQKRNQLVA